MNIRVTVADYGVGNLFNVVKALRHVGADVRVAEHGRDLLGADCLVLPGVGAFADGMQGLAERAMVAPIGAHAARGRPLVGICLGMQLLGTESDEFGAHRGLDLIPGTVTRLAPLAEGVKVPHIGWNAIAPPSRWDGAWQAVEPGSMVYFVHSYALAPRDPRHVWAETSYGDLRFASAVKSGAISGVQFHPEKSGAAGLAILRALLAGSDGAVSAPDVRPEAYYGLPREVRFCTRCVISNQRPNSAVEFRHTRDSKKATIAFDQDGVCDACRLSERKRAIDWAARERALRELCDRFRRNDGRYDCIVPGSGGKDSFYAAHKLKYDYGMHPLTVTWAPHVYTPWGFQNLEAWIHAGFDNYLCTPNGRVHRLLTRLAVDNLFHPFQPFILGQKNLAPKMAQLFSVPLVFYGENEAEYGNPSKDADSAKRDFQYFTGGGDDQIFLGGVSLRELRERYGLEPVDWAPYTPADPAALKTLGLEVHYLGYYLKWHPQSCYYYAVEHGGFQASPERTPGTYSKYNSIDDKIDDFHYYTTYVKFGIGRATYDAAQEIRSADITRDEGVALVKRFDGEFPERFAEEIFAYLSIAEAEFPRAHAAFAEPGMTRARFLALADRFRSPHLWQETDQGWRLRHTVWGQP